MITQLSNLLSYLNSISIFYYVVLIFIIYIINTLFYITNLKHSISSSNKLRKNKINTDFYPAYIKNKQNIWLFTHNWSIINPKGIIFICHGLAEHSLRYEHIARYFNRLGFIVYSIDHQGMGQSEGDRCHVLKFQDYIDDYLLFINKVMDENKSFSKLPKFLLGHSMGGLLSAQISKYYQFTGVIYTSPAFVADPAAATPFMIFIVRSFAYLFPKLGVDKMSLDVMSKDLQAIQQMKIDKLGYCGYMRANWGLECLKMMDLVMNNLSKINTPFLIIHSKNDVVCGIEGSRSFYRGASSSDKKMVELEESLHDLFYDSEWELALNHISKFIKDTM